MPYAPRRPCSTPYCPGFQEPRSSKCKRHGTDERRRIDQKRGSSTSRGYGSQWRKARDGFLALHPLCIECEAEGRVEAATVVDHRIPHKGDMVKFWQVENWQPLCAAHHNIKGATQDGRWG